MDTLTHAMKLLGWVGLLWMMGRPEIGVAQQSVARQWNEALLESIRTDFARPTVHARNLFHTSVAMYDVWAAYDAEAEPILLGHTTTDGYTCAFEGVTPPADVEAARQEAVSFAAYRILQHRFLRSPGGADAYVRYDSLMTVLGYDLTLNSTDYVNGPPAALGNYMAECVIGWGFQDGAREFSNYDNATYEPVNDPLVPEDPGNPNLADPNRWQPLTLDTFIDQSGNEIPFNTPDFLSPEWGIVTPFALTPNDLTVYTRDGHDYWVYHDPGPPPFLDVENGEGTTEAYQWGFVLVAVWSAHLDPADGVMWDISPAAQGNTDITTFPRTIEKLPDFYNFLEGGDPGMGHPVNPATGQPYPPQMVPRGDYARVLAEFWADGPDSETPPGHWFVILNHVMDHPDFTRQYQGEGAELDPLEWDVKAYLTLGGGMHDAAITAWGIKGWYDYIRPISALRGMAALGQSSDPNLPRYAPGGIPLVDGLLELVQPGDDLAGEEGEHVDKIKIFGWRGPDFIADPDTSTAGVGWILMENWWPYQRPSFVTPPFAGYISGHSTYSRAAAEVLTLLTGDPFFPGGVGEFEAPQNEFLVFEDGPSMDLTLQWATYRDASDQTSLSRIWGGIHPPADDIPGRLIGERIGHEAFRRAESHFTGRITANEPLPVPETATLDVTAYPSPLRAGRMLQVQLEGQVREGTVSAYNVLGQQVHAEPLYGRQTLRLHTEGWAPGVYMLQVSTLDGISTIVPVVIGG